MPSESGERRAARTQNNNSNILPHAPPKSADPLPCPRCKSSNTKFCYYNNYNLSQPRHFCKACRRYWTHGGTLRNVPVGGGTRKNSKRPRASSSSTNSASSCSTTNTFNSEPEPSLLPAANPDSDLPVLKLENSSENLNLNESQSENLISLLNTGQQEPAGFMVGYGSNVGYGFGLWGYGGVGELGDGSELLDGDCFTWPSLAISTPAKGLK